MAKKTQRVRLGTRSANRTARNERAFIESFAGAVKDAVRRVTAEANMAAEKIGFKPGSHLPTQLREELDWWDESEGRNLFETRYSEGDTPEDPTWARIACLEGIDYLLQAWRDRDAVGVESWFELIDENLEQIRGALPHAILERPEIDAEWLEVYRAKRRLSEAKRELEEAQKAAPCCQRAA